MSPWEGLALTPTIAQKIKNKFFERINTWQRGSSVSQFFSRHFTPAVCKADSSFHFIFVRAKLSEAEIWGLTWISFILDFMEVNTFKLHETLRLKYLGGLRINFKFTS